MVERPGKASKSKKKGGSEENPILRWYATFRATAQRFGSFAAISVGGLILVAVYGAFAGGHVSRWIDDSMNSIYGGLADMGFSVEDVSLVGRERTNLDSIKRVVDLSRGDPIFAVDCSDIRDRLLALEWVSDARVMRKLPSTLVISITEREAYAIWQQDGAFRLIDRTGAVITEKQVGDFSSLPVVVGKGANDRASEIVDLLARFPHIRKQIRAASFVGQRRWDLHTDSGIQIMLSEEEPEGGLQRLDKLIVEQDILRRAVSVIDLRLKDRFVIRTEGATSPLDGGEAT